jgi:hypothetical protein
MGYRRASAPAARGRPRGAAIVLEGGFDNHDHFFFIPLGANERLSEIWRRRAVQWPALGVVALFLSKGLLNPDFARKLLSWRHSGFPIDNSVRPDGDDHRAPQALAQYVARAPLSLQKLTDDCSGGKVLYHTSYNPYFKQNTSMWSASDFMAHLTQFIPPWGVRLIHYYGLYSSRCKARCQVWPYIPRAALRGWCQSN